MENIWSDFLPSLLGVVLGILLTFGVNFLWRRREEKRRTKDMLILVRNELMTNKEVFKLQEELMKKDGYVYKEILDAKDDLAAIPTDTLKEYHAQIQGITVSTMKNSAWHIFQNSVIIQKMTNKEMVIRLTDCYAWMTNWHEFIAKDYWGTKKKLLLTSELDDPYQFFDSMLKNNEMRNFCDTFRLDEKSLQESFLATDAIIDYVVMLLDKHGDYRYDMEEKDNEVNAYIQSRVMQKKEMVEEKTEN